ncbi:Uncharacterised protein [Candidatus Burarchaeum australiense]|nr:Uncharacterised protein [Candidatus Burarchaeum australiense]
MANDVTQNLQLTPHEMDLLASKARKRGLTVAELIRQELLENRAGESATGTTQARMHLFFGILGKDQSSPQSKRFFFPAPARHAKQPKASLPRSLETAKAILLRKIRLHPAAEAV